MKKWIALFSVFAGLAGLKAMLDDHSRWEWPVGLVAGLIGAVAMALAVVDISRWLAARPRFRNRLAALPGGSALTSILGVASTLGLLGWFMLFGVLVGPLGSAFEQSRWVYDVFWRLRTVDRPVARVVWQASDRGPFLAVATRKSDGGETNWSAFWVPERSTEEGFPLIEGMETQMPGRYTRIVAMGNDWGTWGAADLPRHDPRLARDFLPGIR